MAPSPIATFLLTLAVLALLTGPVHAFGAGNIASISAIEGTNWRHGDIEDTLLSLMMARVAGGKKFDKMTVARVYFGNWLRDYSQAIDVGTVKYVSAEAIRILLWVLGFMTFGYGTREFEVTAARLGCYRPEDHIDNPKDYADNLDAREYDPRLRGPVNERVELAIDPKTGLKNYIANEETGITTSAGHVRQLFTRCIQLGREYGSTRNEAALFEALRLMGTGLHCLEDFSAHSNYTELALIEIGERNVFPFVGRQTQINLPGVQYPVYPVITGTFGGVDFLHSVMGEFDDKATQSEIQQLEGTMQSGSQGNTSLLKDLLGQIPSGLLGDGDPAGKADELEANSNAARLQNVHVTPKRPEALTEQMLSISRQVYPILEWHDDIMRTIAEAIEAIPVLPELIEQLEDQINVFVFSLLAPFMLPVINQIKIELNQGSSEIIQSSKDKQLNVFSDDHSTDPTHSMLSKDHFSDILNEPAGKIASSVVRWVVPQLMQAWDDPRIDINRTINRIVNGVFHHPAHRNFGDDGAIDCRRIMFGTVEKWWRQANQVVLRQQLSREGVEQGLNHKAGEQDTGHGCGKPIGMAKHSGGDGSTGILGELLSALSGGAAATGTGSGYGKISEGASSILGNDALGGIVGALAGGVGGGLLSEVLGGGGSPVQTQAYAQQYRAPGGGVTQSYTEFGQSQAPYGQPQYGQAQYQQTQYPGGGQRSEYKQYQQSGQVGQPAYGYEERVESRPTYGGGYETAQEKIYKKPGGAFEREEWRSGRTGDGEFYEEKKHHERRESGSGDRRYEGHHGERRQEPYDERFEPPPGPPPSSGYGGYPEPTREEFGGGYGGRRAEFEPRREEFGGRGGGFGERLEERREEFGGRGEFGRGFEERREEFRGRGGGFGGGFEERREEFGGRGGGFGGVFEERREEYGGRGGGFGGGFEQRREEFGERGGGFGREFDEEPRQEYGGGGGYEREVREEREEEREQEYREEVQEERYEEDREERREEGGGWGY